MKRARELYNPTKFVTADEIMVAYRGHFSPLRQYMPAKPTKYGIKFWALVCNPERYIYNLIPYLGASGVPEAGQGERVVCRLVSGLEHKGHILVCDNFFTSPMLFDALLSRGVWATGTVKGARIGMPSLLLGLKRGEHPREAIFW